MASAHLIPGFGAPAAGPEAPLDMLATCHLRVERQCQTLLNLQAHLEQHGCDEQCTEAATAVMRYFDSAARHHHEDEEQDLFPALLEAVAGSDATCIRNLTSELSQEHRRLEGLWSALRIALQDLAPGALRTLCAEQVGDFVNAYRRHIRKEDSELLPMARRLLADAALQQMGLSMRQRRDQPMPRSLA